MDGQMSGLISYIRVSTAQQGPFGLGLEARIKNHAKSRGAAADFPDALARRRAATAGRAKETGGI
jgi:hypothetical protein